MRPLAGMHSFYEHHGIDCGDGTVIHYSKGGEVPQVAATPYATFSQGKPIYTKNYAVSYIPDVVIERATSRLGEQQYNLLTNNCEHFATWCKIGRSESKQLESYGFDPKQITLPDSRRLIADVADNPDPVRAIEQFNQAFSNVTNTQAELQAQYDQAKAEEKTWYRAAQLALKQNKEYLARAALERKNQVKRRVDDLQQKLNEIAEIQNSLQQNRLILNRRLTASGFGGLNLDN